jgi:hypothetical protein
MQIEFHHRFKVIDTFLGLQHEVYARAARD